MKVSKLVLGSDGAKGMLYEDDVVQAVCRYLQALDYRITQRLTSKQKGVDIIADLEGPVPSWLRIEAKGQTSKKEESKRYGQEFTRAQKRVHVADAVFVSLKVLSERGGDPGTHAGVALPDTSVHRRLVEEVRGVLQ